jgi:DNA-binding winged helix-turn-helix (wHTH) protein
MRGTIAAKSKIHPGKFPFRTPPVSTSGRKRRFHIGQGMATGFKVLYHFGPFQVDPDRQVLLRENQPVAITPKAFETLLILVRRSREVVSKDELMKAVWPDSFVEEANLSQNIFRIRKALGGASGDERYIVTLPGHGYRFAAQVREVVLDGEDLIIGTRSHTQMVVEQTDLAPNETGYVSGYAPTRLAAQIDLEVHVASCRCRRGAGCRLDSVSKQAST